jgi:membrane dipeptidase
MIRIPIVLLFVVFSACTASKRLTGNPDEIHHELITLDSHTDTPLNLTRDDFDFRKGFESARRANLTLDDLKNSGLDAVFFAVFTGQAERNEAGYRRAASRADQMFDSIYSLVDRFPNELGIARSSDDLMKYSAKGIHAVYIGMENAYPIGKDLSRVEAYYERGTRYITLVHTRNNDVCDSSTDPDGPLFNGLSKFGVSLIEEMNRLGIMVDLSHASDEAFFHALEVSSVPVILSHSSARAVCDHPRNASDEMLKKLAEKGGVIQLCILSDYIKTMEPFPQRDSARQAVYDKHGNYCELDDAGKKAFLKDLYAVDELFPPKLATVADAVDHIDHIVKVAGIDHVGIGTDFDGGGGLADCRHAGELGNITRELIRRGYSKEDLQKIWSGNFLRVMRAAESYKMKKGAF